MKHFLIPAFLLLAACKPPDTTEADKQAVREMETAWAKAGAAKDVAAFLSFYADDAQLLLPNAPLFSGKTAIQEPIKQMMSDPNFALALTPLRLDLSKDLAYTEGSYKMTFSDQRGNKFEDEGNYLAIYKRQADGKWKAVEDTLMSSLPLPPME